MDRNEEILLPTGDYLRQLLGQSKVKPNDLKSILRSRGVFCGSDTKEIVGPILVKTGLSPYEFTELRETYKTKEESQKTKTRSISWKSSEPLIESITEDIDYESLLNDSFGVYQLTNAPGFTALNGNPDHIYMDFEISRNDSIQNWGENVSHHKGRVEFKKADDGKNISMSLVHTAPETKDYGNRISETLIEHFKETGHIDKDEQIKTIKFSDFTNEGRVQFLNELTQKATHSLIAFSDTKDIHFSPDNLISNPPHDLAWMKDKIEDLKIKGKGLHSTFFVNDKKFHKFIKLFGLSCDYSFSTSDYTGKCRILYEFSDHDESNESAELILNITMLKLEVNDSGASRMQVKKQLLDSLERFKMETYDKHKIPTTT